MFAAPQLAHARSGFGGSGATIAPPTVAANAATEAAQQAAKLAKQARDSLSRATHAIQAMQGIQAAARAAAQAAQTSATLRTAVPNGLGAGGLLPNIPAGWTGADHPTQSVDASGQTNVGVNQTSAQAILNWKSFNVGAKTTLTFDQHGNASWVALNRVDATTGPSQVLGNIKADGTVLVINQSGIIFGGASQINVGSLIASSANIADSQFLTSGIYSTQISGSYVPNFTGAGDGATGGIGGKIIVESGALITTNAPASVTEGGGSVLLMGTDVGNAGSITTPKGQIELAAGHDFILRPGLGTDANQFSTTRGSEIATGTWTGAAGTAGTWAAGGGIVDNTGIAFAQQGDITLAGHSISQDGLLLSTTSVNQRGTIHLLNSASDTSGSITLTGNSLALILPELDSTDTALNSQRDALIADSATQNLARSMTSFGRFDDLSKLTDREDQSRVEIVTGGTVNFQNGSLTQAQGGQVSVSAGKRIFTESGATIDVSGVQGVLLPMSANEIQVNIQGNELRDSPDNRDTGDLASKDVWVDVRDLILVPAGTGGYATDRYYTPGGLLEVSGYLNNADHTIGEWTAVAGSITLSAPEVVAQQGSTFNISGGSLQYQSGYLHQTYVLGSDGRIYNINDAPTDITLKAVVTGFVADHPHWNVTEIYQSPWGNKTARWEEGYTVGRDAGQLILSAPTSLFAGDIVAGVTNGERQTNARPSGVTDGYKFAQDTVALPGALTVATFTTNPITGVVDTPATTSIVLSDSTAAQPGLGDTIDPKLVGTTQLNPEQLSFFGLGGLVLEARSAVTIGAPVALAAGGNFQILAPDVDISANVVARGGSITVTNVGSDGSVFRDSSGGASVTVEPGVTIDTRGLWTNAELDPAKTSGLAYIDGGDVTVQSTGDVILSKGAAIDASSGGAILANSKTQGGAGGDITLIANYAPAGVTQNDHGKLTLDGEIASYGFTRGGHLTLGSDGIVVVGGDFNLGTSMQAGEVLPVDVVLTKDVVWPAGVPLPAAALAPQVVTIPAGPLASNLVITPGQSIVLTTDIVVGAEGIDSSNFASFYFYTSPTGASVSIDKHTGGVIPKGSTLTNPTTFFANKNILSQELDYSVISNQPAGSVLDIPVTFHAGDVLRGDSVLPVPIEFEPISQLNLSADLLSSGFSSYDIHGDVGLVIGQAGAEIHPTTPVLQFTQDSFSVATNGDPYPVLSHFLAPNYYIEDPVAGKLTQRPGVDLKLSSGRPYISGSAESTNGWVDVPDGVSIEVDPGHDVTLESGRQITVDGSITAHGGTISLLDSHSFDPNGDLVGASGPGAASFWIGDDAVLDVSAQAYIAKDLQGRRYGVVPHGGTIEFGRVPGHEATANLANAADAYIIIRPGALLDASGTQGVIDLAPAPGGIDTVFTPTVIASDGGSISLRSYDGIYAEGTMKAMSGGAGAAGGTLDVELEAPYFANSSASPAPAFLMVGRVLEIDEDAVPDPLAADLLPGQMDSTLVLGRGGISARQIEAGGFDDVSLWGRDAIVFDGDVTLTAGRSITLNKGAIYAGATGTNVTLNAPYVFLDGGVGVITPKGYTSASVLPAALTSIVGGSFNITDASLIDVRNSVATHFADTNFDSNGDIRFLAGKDASVASALTSLSASDGNLLLAAEQVYPASGATVTVTAGYTVATPFIPGSHIDGATLTIASVGETTPDLPYSVFGTISFLAPVVRQDGVIRAPLGSITVGVDSTDTVSFNSRVELLPGSLTSVSAAGLVMPYGGTVDGVTYTVDGAAPAAPNLLTGQFGKGTQGVSLVGTQVTADAGSVVDLSGGGTLLGAAFISGRGGSVDVLTTPLVNANPANTYSSADDQVFAILPGVKVAPPAGGANVAWTGDVPKVGQQITITDGVPGLSAGTYTLLPANYALLPGAYRVELGATSTTLPTRPVALANGSYLVAGYQGVANTAIRDSLATQAIVTPGTAVRTLSQYDEMGYDAFQSAQAATFGTLRPLLPEDGKFFDISLRPLAEGDANVADFAGAALTFNGETRFTAAQDGYDGSLGILTSNFSGAGGNELFIAADGSTVQRSATLTPVAASTIDAIGAPSLYLGGIPKLIFNEQQQVIEISSNSFFDTTTNTSPSNPVTLESGATLRGSQVIIAGGDIDVQDGASINTLGRGAHAPDSTVTGYEYVVGGQDVSAVNSLLAVSNGHLEVGTLGNVGNITVGDGASLFAEGSIGFVTQGVNFVGQPLLAARELTLALPSINIGTDAALAAAGTLPNGLDLDQSLLDLLLTGNSAIGAPAVQNLTLSASKSVNFYGSVDLDFSGAGNGVGQLVLDTPAIYGVGASGDVASITVDTLVWNGSLNGNGASLAPGAIPAGGAGAGVLTVNARQIVLGYAAADTPTSTIALDRLALGFSAINLNASESITANNKGSLSVYATGADPSGGFDPKTYAGTGGVLNLSTPLLTGAAGSVLSLYAGEAVNLSRPADASSSAAAPSALGASIDINSDGSVNLDSSIYLPSGRFSVTAANDVVLGANSRLDLSGQSPAFFDVTKYTWGGDVLLESTSGNIVQNAGSVIDVSATGSDAGSLTITATGASQGTVLLGGTLLGSGGMGGNDGLFDIRAQKIGVDVGQLSSDFAALNARLNDAGFTESRSFLLKQGDLTIGDELKAHHVSVSVDGGSLVVNGTVDASGAQIGSISLAARDDVVINGVLDAHGTVTRVDSQGVAIGASNTAEIELSTSEGRLVLNSGAVFDVRSADGVSRGKLTLDAPRLGSTGPSVTGVDAPANATGSDIAIDAAGALDIRGAQSIVLNGFARYSNAPVDPADANGQVVTQAFLDQIDQDNVAFENAALANAGLQGRIVGLTAYGSAFHLRPGVEIDSATPDGDITESGDIDLAGYRYGPGADRDKASATYGAGEAMALVIRASGNINVNGNISDGFKETAAVPDQFFDPVTDITTDPAFIFTNVLGGYYKANKTVYLTADWTVPSSIIFILFKPTEATTGRTFAAGRTVPAGTALSLLAVPVPFIGTASAPSLAKTLIPGSPAQPSTSPNASPLAAGSSSSSIRLVAGADLSAAATRTLTASSALAGSGNLVLSDYHIAAGATTALASVLRTGAGDLDLLAGGNFSQDSIYDVSTRGWGDADPANLYVAVQGNMTSLIYSGYGATDINTDTISNWATTANNFVGFGALDGGNVTLRIGGDAGKLTTPTIAPFNTSTSSPTMQSTGLVVGSLGGGDVKVSVGGNLNPGIDHPSDPDGALNFDDSLNGVFTNLRGNIDIGAGTIGSVPLLYGIDELNDPRAPDSSRATMLSSLGGQGGPVVTPGDGVATLRARGDLVLGGVGKLPGAETAIWQPTTGIDLFSAGGNLVPYNTKDYDNPNENLAATANANTFDLPPIFTATAASGSIYYSGLRATTGNGDGFGSIVFKLAASPQGQLELLAQDSIYGAASSSIGSPNQGARFDMTGADADPTLFADPARLHENDPNPIRVYAVEGDVVDVTLGQVGQNQNLATVYAGAKAVEVLAGRDIVNFGQAEGAGVNAISKTSPEPSFILNTNEDDVSVIQAGRDIWYANVEVAGPGTLDVTAGRNLYQGDKGSITSIGPIASGDTRPGASIAVQVGAGAAGPDYAAFVALYLDPANLAVSGVPLSDQPGKVVKTYQDELRAWLQQRYGYAATSDADALVYFSGLSSEQQDIFVRQVYFAELKAGGREFNDPNSSRFGSYLRGREAIAALFPASSSYAGDLTMFGGSGIRTLFGGDISILTPGGQTAIGTDGVNPPGTAGVVTQGAGDIDIYSLDSVLLGQSRIMTTFGGNILAWSATGDINAGRGAKTTVVFTPPKRVSDLYGHVTLSPQVPSTGAGIGTLQPIPEVPRGDIDLIAPLGTIDAGEAGIRVSGNVNLAALQVVNAANIQVQGASTGLPTVSGPPVAALTAASNVAGAAQPKTETAPTNSGQASVMIVEIIGYGGSQGSDQDDNDDRKNKRQ